MTPVRRGRALPAMVMMAAMVTVVSWRAAAQDAPKKPEADKTAEEMARLRADLLARHQGADEARLTQLMGPPADRAVAGGTTTLTWKGPTEAGADAPCRIAMSLASGGLANLELSGHPAWDRKLCRKFLRPLLQALPWSEVHKTAPDTGAAAALVLTNADILAMVKEGLPPETVTARLHAQPCRFDVSIDALGGLRRAGVPESVLQTMADRRCN